MLRYLLILMAAFSFGPHVMAQGSERQAVGVVIPKERAVLSGQRSGYLTELNVQVGDRVEQGDVIARFECRMDDLALETAQAELELAQSNANLQSNLRKQGAVGQSAVEASEIEVRLKEILLKTQQAKLDYCDIKAPFSGVIVEKFVQPFETLQAGETVVEIANSAELRIEVIVPVIWMIDVRDMKVFDFKVEFSDHVFSVDIVSISPNIDPVSQTVKVIGSINVEDLDQTEKGLIQIGAVGTSYF